MVRIVVPVIAFITLLAFIFTIPAASALVSDSGQTSAGSGHPGMSGSSGSGLFAKSGQGANPHTTISTRSTPAPVQYFDQSSGEATIGSSPAGAQVYIDGSYRGITPVSVKGVSTGQHTLRLVLPGYTDFNGGLSVTSGKVSESVTTLIPNTTGGVANTGFRWDDPVVLLTVLGIVTTVVGAAVTIVSIVESKKKEREKPPDQGSSGEAGRISNNYMESAGK